MELRIAVVGGSLVFIKKTNGLEIRADRAQGLPESYLIRSEELQVLKKFLTTTTANAEKITASSTPKEAAGRADIKASAIKVEILNKPTGP